MTLYYHILLGLVFWKIIDTSVPTMFGEVQAVQYSHNQISSINNMVCVYRVNTKYYYLEYDDTEHRTERSP